MSEAVIGPLEQRYRESAAFRNASDQSRVTRTHWHIAVANGLGWGFDGMDGLLLALSSPLLIKEFGVSLSEWRTGAQISIAFGIAGIFFWPWLADRFGRRSLLAINIAVFSLMMPVVALMTTFTTFVIARSLVYFALNGEWTLGSMLVAESWPPRLRGRVISINRGTWCFGAALAGTVGALVIARPEWGWRTAFFIPAIIALVGVYVRMRCPESPYWVRTQDRKRRIQAAREAGAPISPEDAEWLEKTKRVPIGQLFQPDMWRSTAVATFVACCSTIIYGTVGGWLPLYLSKEHGWSTATYSTFYIFWGLIGFLGLLASGIIADKFGRKPAFYTMLIEGAFFLTLWVYAESDTALWIYGLLWSIGFLGFWGPSTTLTSEIYPTRIRGVGNGFTWGMAWLVGFVLWPFVTVWLTERTGSFGASFLIVPVAMILMGLGIYLFSPENAGKELNEIAV